MFPVCRIFPQSPCPPAPASSLVRIGEERAVQSVRTTTNQDWEYLKFNLDKMQMCPRAAQSATAKYEIEG